MYFRRDQLLPAGESVCNLLRLDPGSTVGSGDGMYQASYRSMRRLMGNEWATTRTAPSATLYGGDIAYGWRINEMFPKDWHVRNRNAVHTGASGQTEKNITDFDDVTFVVTKGLRDSLAAVRR